MDNNKIGQHISEQFNNELKDIHNNLLTMGGLVERQLEMTIQAIETGDRELAEQVIKKEHQVETLEKTIDHECMQTLALRQPTAYDLRLLITVIKIINELESINKKAGWIAEITLKSIGSRSSFSHYELEHLTVLVKGMLHDALNAFARLSLENVSGIMEREANVDREYENVLRRLNTRMMEDPRNITRSLEVLETVRALERIGDHACYICEHLFYMIKGEYVRLADQ
ncbi:MAG: phosphate transport system regulatory protein PhoU [Methylococcales bacterium]|nr:MAG: phosphate transport system regulatory protein PhoU [Methylococcales bacterium]